MRRVDVVVVGAGMAGAATAWELAGRGRQVTVLEQHGAGHDRGSSHGAGRIVRMAYRDPFYVALARQAYAGWARLEQECGRRLVTTTGGVDHGDAAAVAAVAGALSAAGIRHEVLDPRDAERRWPAMRFAGPVLYQPDSGVVDAGAAVAAFLETATARGADVRFDTRVLAVHRAPDGVVVSSSAGELLATAVVVAAGAWLPRLLGGALSLPPLVVTEEQPVFFRPPGPLPVFIHYAPSDAAREFAAYGLVSGVEGLKVGEHLAGRVVDPDARPAEERDGATAAVVRYVERWLPGVDPTPLGSARCLYTTTRSEDFVLDRDGPLVVVSACSGHGFKFAPQVGALAADLVEGSAPLDRFRLAAHA